MTVNKDLVTTIVGCIGAAVVAAKPVLDLAQGATMDLSTVAQLVMAITVGIIGFFTGRPQAVKAP